MDPTIYAIVQGFWCRSCLYGKRGPTPGVVWAYQPSSGEFEHFCEKCVGAQIARNIRDNGDG